MNETDKYGDYEKNNTGKMKNKIKNKTLETVCRRKRKRERKFHIFGIELNSGILTGRGDNLIPY